MPDTHTYDYNDIQRYLEQQMTPDEMHAFEKAMMEDPFLADAMEGFQNSDAGTAARHLKEIEQQITGDEKKSKVVPVMPPARRWWRIAALFILLAGMGIITYKLLNKTPAGNEIAGSIPEVRMDTLRPATEALKQETMSLEEIAGDTKRTTSPVIKETAVLKEKNEELIASSGRMKPPPGDASALDMRKSEMQQPALESTTAAGASLYAGQQSGKPSVARSTEQQFKGQVTDVKGTPLRSASVMINNGPVTTTDSNGKFSITAPDTTLQVNVTSVGFEPATAQIKSKETLNTIVLNQSNLALNEVVAGYGKRREKATLEKAAPTANAPVMAEPQNGWPMFYQYVNTALKTIKDTATKYLSGDVLLRFTIDNKGNPVNIQATNAHSKEMEAKAIELLQKGPRWKPGAQNANAEVVIRF